MFEAVGLLVSRLMRQGCSLTFQMLRLCRAAEEKMGGGCAVLHNHDRACRRLVEWVGGEIGAETGVGEGSVFWFELPFQRGALGETEAPAARPPKPASGPRLVGAHLLVVDDSAMNRDLVVRALALEGWVRNRRDGTVEALISGAPEAVETLTAWAFQGPSTARVDQVLFNDEPDPRAGELEGDFRLRPTF